MDFNFFDGENHFCDQSETVSDTSPNVRTGV
jgi:hypothetical protein